MRRSYPAYLRLHPHRLQRRSSIRQSVVALLHPNSAHLARIVSRFAFRNDEGLFARQLLAVRSQFWLYRTSQRAFAGDFFVFDLSSPCPERRRAWVLDLKQGAPLRIGGGGAGIQFRGADRVLEALAEQTGIIAPSQGAERVSGGRISILNYFGVSVWH